MNKRKMSAVKGVGLPLYCQELMILPVTKEGIKWDKGLVDLVVLVKLFKFQLILLRFLMDPKGVIIPSGPAWLKVPSEDHWIPKKLKDSNEGLLNLHLGSAKAIPDSS